MSGLDTSKIVGHIKNYCLSLVKHEKVYEFLFLLFFWGVHIVGLFILFVYKDHELVLVSVWSLKTVDGTPVYGGLWEVWFVLELLCFYCVVVFRPNYFKNFLLFLYFVYSTFVSFSSLVELDKLIDFVYKDSFIGILRVFSYDEKVQRIHFLVNEKLKSEGLAELPLNVVSQINFSADLNKIFLSDLDQVADIVFNELKSYLIQVGSTTTNSVQKFSFGQIFTSLWQYSPLGASLLLVGGLAVGCYLGFQFFNRDNVTAITELQKAVKEANACSAAVDTNLGNKLLEVQGKINDISAHQTTVIKAINSFLNVDKELLRLCKLVDSNVHVLKDTTSANFMSINQLLKLHHNDLNDLWKIIISLQKENKLNCSELNFMGNGNALGGVTSRAEAIQAQQEALNKLVGNAVNAFVPNLSEQVDAITKIADVAETVLKMLS